MSPDRDASFRSGYLLGVEQHGLAVLPATSELEQALRKRLIRPIEAATGRGYKLSFLKTACGPPPRVGEGVHHDGFHLDTHPEITSDEGRELARILINLAEEPREVRFAEVDRYELARRGLAVHRGDYQVVELPSEVATRSVEIPGVTRSKVHALRFWASVVPHVGAERPHGHFLASYEAIAPFPAEP